MNTISQTIAKLIILPLFGGALITGVAIGTADSAAANNTVIGWDPIAPAAPAAPARPDVILNGIRVDAEAPAPAPVAPAPVAPAPASKPADPGQQESAVPAEVARRAARAGVPVMGLAGSIGRGADAVHEVGIDAITSIVDLPMALSDAFAQGQRMLIDATEQMMRMVLVGVSISDPRPGRN